MFDNIVGLLQLMNEKSLPHLKVNRRDINESSELSSVTFVSRRHNMFVVHFISCNRKYQIDGDEILIRSTP
jgi:hypothetical protein